MFPVAGERASIPSAMVLDTDIVQFFRPRVLARHLGRACRHVRGNHRPENRGKKSAPAIMELTIDPVSVLKNVKPTMAASVVAMNPIHESPWESFLGFRLGGGQ